MCEPILMDFFCTFLVWLREPMHKCFKCRKVTTLETEPEMWREALSLMFKCRKVTALEC